MSTLQTPRGTWNIRYGTDKSPKRTAAELAEYKTKNNLWFKLGPMKGYKGDRRYSSKSKLLQASGLFKMSFRKIRVSNRLMLSGTKHRLADKIQRRGRQVLHVTNKDLRKYTKLWQNFLFRNLFR